MPIQILNIMNLLKNIDWSENDKEYFGKFESQRSPSVSSNKEEEKSYDEVASICSDILLEFPHNKNAKELLKQLPYEDFFYRGE